MKTMNSLYQFLELTSYQVEGSRPIYNISFSTTMPMLMGC